MKLEEYARYDGIGLAELVRKKEVTPRELAELANQAVEKVNPQINAVIEVFTDRIESPGDKPYNPDAPFVGIPMFLKDLGATDAGRKREMGSRLTKGNVAIRDSFLTQRFKAAGLNIIGRTTTPEFGISATTESILMGKTRNPWNLERSPGGSSGGSSACVASGIVPISHGSDGGGSIRSPASCCGLVGLKPSRGRITSGPARGESTDGMAVEFAVTRTVRDTAALLDAVSAPAPGDSFIIIQPDRPYIEEVGAPVEKLWIAFTTKSFQSGNVDPEVARATEAVARKCESMGHVVEEAWPSYNTENAFLGFIKSGLSDLLGLDFLSSNMKRPIDSNNLEAVVLNAYHSAKKLTVLELLIAQERLNAVRREIGPFFNKYDILLTSTTSVPAAPLGTLDNNHDVSIDEQFNKWLDFNPNLFVFNITGQPAISLPLSISESGLPLGAQLVARFGREDVLIRLAAALEEAMPWRDRKPPVHVSRQTGTMD